MGRSQHSKADSGKILIQEVHTEDVVEEPIEPEHVRSKFKTLQEWLINICNNNKPKKSIAEFYVNFSESSGNYTIFLWGVNTYAEGKNRSITRIEFQPLNMYNNLAEKEYNN